MPFGHAAGDDVLRADPQDDHHARQHHEDGDRGEQGAGARRGGNGAVGGFHRVPVAPDRQGLGAESLHGAHRNHLLDRIGRRIREPVLGGLGARPHRTAGEDQRQDDERNGDQHQGRQAWARIDHHRRAADQQKPVAQQHGRGEAEDALHLGRVGGEPRHDLAGAVGVEKGRFETCQMGEDAGAHIGDDALAERADEVVARGAGQGEHRRDADQRDEIGVDRGRAATRAEAQVDHPAHGERQGERRGRRGQERERGERDASLVMRCIGRQGLERAEPQGLPTRRPAARRIRDLVGGDAMIRETAHRRRSRLSTPPTPWDRSSRLDKTGRRAAGARIRRGLAAGRDNPASASPSGATRCA